MSAKTVVELDLVGYNAIASMLEEGIDVGTVAHLNDQIQGIIDAGLQAVGAERSRNVMQTTGDGAILIFDAPLEAHGFAAAIHSITREHNRNRHRSIGKRVFRVGIATGEIHMCPRPDGGHTIAGTVISRAVRLEAGAPPGGILSDEATYAGLTPEQQACYVGPRRVKGKRDELFDARTCVLNPEGAKDAAAFLVDGPATNDPKPDDGDDELVERLPEELLRELLRAPRVAEAPTDLDAAIRRGLSGVDRQLREIEAAARYGLDLKHVLAVASEAIQHGAGIYNHSSAGRVGCARIYHRAAVGLTSMVLPLPGTGDAIPKGAFLALDWLERIIANVPEVTAGNGDETAWELRFAFDAMPLVPQFDSVSNALGAAAGRAESEPALCGLLRQIVEDGRALREPQIAAYLLLHTARVLVRHPAANRSLNHHREPLRNILEERPRIGRSSAVLLVRRLGQALIQFCQNVEAGAAVPDRPARKWWPFGK